MPAKLRGIQQAIGRTSQIVDDITAVRIVRALKSAAYIIRTESATMIPIDTSALINSQYDTIDVNGTVVTAKVGYSARYALYVHNASGKLVHTQRQNGNGYYWDPHAEPMFLTKAAEKTKELVDKIIRKEMKL